MGMPWAAEPPSCSHEAITLEIQEYNHDMKNKVTKSNHVEACSSANFLPGQISSSRFNQTQRQIGSQGSPNVPRTKLLRQPVIIQKVPAAFCIR